MSASITVEVLSKSMDSEYIDLLDKLGRTSPAVLCYHYPLYRDMLAHIGVGKPLYLGARLDTELVAVLPGFVRTSEIGSVYCSLPFFGPNAGVICANNDRTRKYHEILLNAVLKHLRDHENLLSATFYTPLFFDQFEYYDHSLPDAIVVDKFTHSTYLPDFKASSSIAYDIRKAKKSGVTISTEITPQNMDMFYSIYKKNCEDYGIPLKPRLAIKSLLDGSDSANRARAYFAFHENSIIASLFVLFSPLTISYYLPCALHSVRSLQPGAALIHRAMQDAQERGMQYWNWESSPSRDSGVCKFKKKWGSIESGYRIYVVPYKSEKIFKRIGKEQLSLNFPYFFVYPFDRL